MSRCVVLLPQLPLAVQLCDGKGILAPEGAVLTRATLLQSLYGAKVQAHASHKDYLEIKLEKETEVRTLSLSCSRRRRGSRR